MPTWKKVIVSGSQAHLAAVTASSGVLVGTNQSITTTQAGTYLTGSFTGSFTGNGSGLTDVTATATFPSTQLTPILSTTQIFANDGTNKYVTAGQIYTGSWAGISGDIVISNAGVASIQANSVALGTDTTGNYVADVTAGNGIAVTHTPGEGSSAAVALKNNGSLSNNTLVKWTTASTQLANSLITDDGTTVTIGGDLVVNGTTTTVNATNLIVADAFITLASGSTNNSSDGGILIDRGAYAGGNVAYGYDLTTVRWGFQNGLADTTNGITIGTDGNSSFVGLVFTEGAHGATKPTSGEFAVQGAIYSANNGDIWIYSGS